MFEKPIFAEKQFLIGDHIGVLFSDGSYKYYDAVALGCAWFKMSNDSFADMYGFNFNPHTVPGLYERCRKIVHGNLA